MNSKVKCSESLVSFVQQLCSGSNNCTVSTEHYLASCSNERAHMVVIDFNCLPGREKYSFLIKINFQLVLWNHSNNYNNKIFFKLRFDPLHNLLWRV